MPNKQLEEYFDSESIDLGIEFDKIKENDTEVIFNAFLELAEEQQTIIETDFQNINALACEGGIRALVDESVFFHDEVFVESISAIDGFHSKVSNSCHFSNTTFVTLERCY